ncbi:zinc ribbon domain-containing protein [Oleiharenicola sp. Vm1]|uniref:zinc ribbon domain-containing protein n=1 Tax=Oleiharenicola sp. Vm1 TaxID=3398393 RepID=UPI0039F55962
MAAIKMDNLLAWQEADMKRLALEQQLAAAPRDIAAVEARIAAERQAIETAKSEWHSLEARKKALENDIKSAQEKAAKYRTQQLEVRKNDEYRALTHEIETTEATIGGFEEEELKVMYAIDEAKKRFAEAERALKQNISGHEGRIAALRAHEQELRAEHGQAVTAAEAARAHVPEPQVRLYDRLAKKPGLPACVPVQGGRCGGCHMKVSSNIEFEARKAENIVTCDQCGRIVYWRL